MYVCAAPDRVRIAVAIVVGCAQTTALVGRSMKEKGGVEICWEVSADNEEIVYRTL